MRLGKQTDPRSGRRYRKVRNDFIARMRALNAPCWLIPLGHCVLDGAPIDYVTPGRNPRSPELHHKRSVYTHPWLVYEPSNFAVGHAKCNQVLGKRSPLLKVQLAQQHSDTKGTAAQRNWVSASW